MARSKEFDVDEALQSALEVFWQKGYEATSVQDLVGAMGIQKASLYGTYGDKHSLYLRALRTYQASALEQMAQTLQTPGSPKGAIRALLQGVADKAAGRPGRRGCFCVNANVELAPHDADVAELMRTHTDRVIALLTRTCEAARDARELPRDSDCSQLGAFLFGLLVAMNVLGKQRASRERIQALVERGMVALAA